MSRNLSIVAKQELFKQSSSMVIPVFVDISYVTSGGATQVLHLVNNTEPLTYLGTTYTPFAFRFDPPSETATSISGARITVDAVDQSVIAILRDTPNAPVLTFVATFYFDESGTIYYEQLASWAFNMKNFSYNVDTITCELEYDIHWDDQVGSVYISPSTMPGLF